MADDIKHILTGIVAGCIIAFLLVVASAIFYNLFKFISYLFGGDL